MNKDKKVDVVDSREVEGDPMEKVLDLTIMCKTRKNMSGRMKIKARLNGKVVIPTKLVLVHTKEEVILTLEVVFMVNVINIEKKVMDPLNLRNLVKMFVEML